MWPLISPASGDPVSFIFDLIRLWPVFHISGVPPSSATRSNKAWLALTSAMIVAPGSSFSTGSARIESNWSPQMTRPSPSTAPIRSPSPSKAMPKSSPFSRDQPLQIREILLDRRIGMMVGEAAVDLGVEHVMLARQALDQPLDDRPARAVAGVPADPEGAAVEILEQAVDIAVHHLFAR